MFAVDIKLVNYTIFQILKFIVISGYCINLFRRHRLNGNNKYECELVAAACRLVVKAALVVAKTAEDCFTVSPVLLDFYPYLKIDFAVKEFFHILTGIGADFF